MKRLATACAVSFLLPYTATAETVRAYDVEQTSQTSVVYDADPTQTSNTEFETLADFKKRSQAIFENAVKSGQRSKTTIERGELEPLEVSFPLTVQGHDLTVPKGDIINGKPEFLATVRDESGAAIVGEISETIETFDNEGKERCYKFADSMGDSKPEAASDSASLDPITSYVSVVVDISYSMSNALPQVKKDVQSFLSTLPQESTMCRVLAFDHELHPIHSGDGQRCDTIDVSGLEAQGGTDIFQALNAEYAFYADLPDNALHSVVMMTDGYDNTLLLTGDRKKDFIETKGDTKSFVYYEGAEQNNAQLDGVSDAVLEQGQNIAFSFMEYLDVMRGNVSGQRRLVEVACAGDT